MRRREFIALLGTAAGCLSVRAHAQQPSRMRRIGVLLASETSDPEMQARLGIFEDGLRALGWVKGGNIEIDLRWYGGSPERAARYATEIASLGPDVIVANATVGVEAVRKATQIIPTVFVMLGNPVGSGYVASMSRPGANLTGFSAFEPEIAGKWMQLITEIAPATKQVTVLSHPGYEFLWNGAEAAAAALGLAATQVRCHNAGEIDAAISALGARRDAGFVVLPAPVFAANRDMISRLASSHGVPAVYPFRYYAAAGGLMAYGIAAADVWRRAPSYVDRILKGENPGNLPIQAPTRFELVINLKAAKALGLNVPSSLLGLADEVIE
jgi:putative ABC transport system substrate-binding protein